MEKNSSSPTTKQTSSKRTKQSSYDQKIKLECIEPLLEYVNQIRTQECENFPFYFKCLVKNDMGKVQTDLLSETNDCFQAMNLCIGNQVYRSGLAEKLCFALAAVESKTNRIVSYLLCTEAIDPDMTVNNPPRFIHIEYSCTHPKYRRKGLSLILRIIVVLYALAFQIPYITSLANRESSHMLQEKLDFMMDDRFISRNIEDKTGATLYRNLSKRSPVVQKHELFDSLRTRMGCIRRESAVSKRKRSIQDPPSIKRSKYFV